MSRKAMQVALEALESDPLSHAGLVSRKQAITTLRQALETQQESVKFCTYPKCQTTAGCAGVCARQNTTPQPRQWVGLTDEERHNIREWQEIQKELGPVWAPMMLYLYLAIEQALKEKNT